ncbi:hypothetical protein BDV18DRAFT_161690 [Aspergillus unguis]
MFFRRERRLEDRIQVPPQRLQRDPRDGQQDIYRTGSVQPSPQRLHPRRPEPRQPVVSQQVARQQAPSGSGSSYDIRVRRLRGADITRRVGSGTSPTDPLIRWICPTVSDRDRMYAIDNICREACSITGSTMVWVRSIDHRTTRINSGRGGRNNRGGSRRGGTVYVPADPHITVYMGRSEEFDYEGHLYVAYHHSAPHIPARLADPRERERPRYGMNPDLYNARAGGTVRFRHQR